MNKADLGGAEKTVKWLKSMILMDQEAVEILSKTGHADEYAVESGEIFERMKRSKDWIPPIITTVADRGEGIEELVEAIENHFSHLKASGKLKERRVRRISREVFSIITEEIRSILINERGSRFREVVEMVVNNEIDPHTAAEKIIIEIRTGRC